MGSGAKICMIYATGRLANYLKQFQLVIVICGRMSGLESKKNRKIAKIKLEKFKTRNLIGGMSDTLLCQVS